MKIGFVFDDNLNRPDGVQQYISTLGSWLEKQGHEVKYLVSNSDKPIVPPNKVIGLSKSINIKGNKNTLALPLPASSYEVRQVLKQENFDILHVQMPYSPFLSGKVIKNITSEKLIGTFHIVGHGWFEKVGSNMLALLQKQQYKKFNKIVSVSSAAQSYARSNFKIESTVIPNVFNRNSFTTSKKSFKKLKIIFMGRLVERKGCLNLLKAVNLLKDDFSSKQMQVTIAGKGPQRDQLESYVKLKQLQDYVSFIGFVKEEDKARIFSEHNVAVFPSTGGESFGIILLEAMTALNGVVLAGNNQGYATVMPKEFLFDRFSPKAIVKYINKYYPKNLDEVKALQTKVAAEYDVEKVGKKIIKIYKKA